MRAARLSITNPLVRKALPFIQRIECCFSDHHYDASSWKILVERDPTRKVSVQDLKDWKGKALVSARNAGFEGDGNKRASLRDLETEMKWLLEDCVVGHQSSPEESEAAWNVCSWSAVEAGLVIQPISPSDLLLMRLDLEELQDLWARRINDCIPIQYLTNTVYWRDLTLLVGPGVLIPRPETEQLIDLVDNATSKLSGPDHPWVDLGTGTGAIGISLSRILGEGCTVLTVDISPQALQCAKQNVLRYGVRDRVKVISSSWLQSLKDFKGQIGGIVSNPPYIPSGDMDNLQVEVGQHEPKLALDGGSADGTAYILEILHQSRDYLSPGGFLALETNGQQQSDMAAQVMSDMGAFKDVRVHKDYFGVQRFVTGYRQ